MTDLAELVRDRLELRDGELVSRRRNRPIGHYADQDGYRRFSLTHRGRRYMLFVHRVVWLLHTGDWPKQVIDHINRDRTDNRIENLRDVSIGINVRNREGVRPIPEPPAGNKYIYAHKKSWRVSLPICGKRILVGHYPTILEARAARDGAIRLLHAAPMVDEAFIAPAPRPLTRTDL
jgi:hypothetical protein